MYDYISLGGAIILGTGAVCAITCIVVAVVQFIQYARS